MTFRLPRFATSALALAIVSLFVATSLGLSNSARAASAQVVTIGTSTYPLSGTDVPRVADALVLYTSTATQTVAPTNQWGAEIALVSGKVTAIRDQQKTGEAAMPIPAGGKVLSGHGSARTWLLSNAKVGIPVSLPGDTQAVVQSGSSSFPYSGANIFREADTLVSYTRVGSQVISPANQWGAEATVVDGKVTILSDRQTTGAAGNAIPTSGYVLSGHGSGRTWLLANAKPGSAVTTGSAGPTIAPTGSPTASPTASPSAAPTATAPTPQPAVSGNLPAKVVGGYLTTWESRNGVTLRSVVDNTNYNLIYVAFAIGVNATSGSLQLDLPPGVTSAADFKSQVAYANSKGKKVVISVGGWYDLPGQTSGYNLSSPSRVDQFMASIASLRDSWGFNGMDWDLEHGDRTDQAGIVSASKQMRAAFGPTWIICFAPAVNLASWVGAGGILDTIGPDGWDAVGEQIYIQGLSEAGYQSLIVNRMTALSRKYGASKVVLGNMYKNDTGTSLADPSNSFVDISTTKAALANLRAGGTNVRGAFVWTIQSDSDEAFAWQASSGVGGDILAHP